MRRALTVASIFLLAFGSGAYAKGGGHGSGHSSNSGSHVVHSYTRSNGAVVHAHEAGNPSSGNHWRLSRDHTTDTLTRPDGTTETIPAPN
jgi:hypothetical protein